MGNDARRRPVSKSHIPYSAGIIYMIDGLEIRSECAIPAKVAIVYVVETKSRIVRLARYWKSRLASSASANEEHSRSYVNDSGAFL